MLRALSNCRGLCGVLKGASVVYACTKVRLSDIVALRRPRSTILLGCMMGIKWQRWLGVECQGMEWRWAGVRDWRVDSASAFGLHHNLQLGTGGNNDCMI